MSTLCSHKYLTVCIWQSLLSEMLIFLSFLLLKKNLHSSHYTINILNGCFACFFMLPKRRLFIELNGTIVVVVVVVVAVLLDTCLLLVVCVCSVTVCFDLYILNSLVLSSQVNRASNLLMTNVYLK